MSEVPNKFIYTFKDAVEESKVTGEDLFKVVKKYQMLDVIRPEELALVFPKWRASFNFRLRNRPLMPANKVSLELYTHILRVRDKIIDFIKKNKNLSLFFIDLNELQKEAKNTYKKIRNFVKYNTEHNNCKLKKVNEQLREFEGQKEELRKKLRSLFEELVETITKLDELEQKEKRLSGYLEENDITVTKLSTLYEMIELFQESGARKKSLSTKSLKLLQSLFFIYTNLLEFHSDLSNFENKKQ